MPRLHLAVLAFLLVPAWSRADPPSPGTASSPTPSADACVAHRLHLPADLAPHLLGQADLWFRVTPEGKIASLHGGDVATQELRPYLADALRQCDWARFAGDEVDLKLTFRT
jgi:hypothetical protein